MTTLAPAGAERGLRLTNKILRVGWGGGIAREGKTSYETGSGKPGLYDICGRHTVLGAICLVHIWVFFCIICNVLLIKEGVDLSTTCKMEIK